MSKLEDVSTRLRDGPYLSFGPYGGKTIYNYKSERFGVCNMCVNTVEPEPMQEAIMYLRYRFKSLGK